MGPEIRDSERLYQAAVQALEQGRWAEARRLAEMLLPHGRRHAGLHALAGIAALQERQMGAALAYLRRAVSLAPGRTDYAVELARALCAAGALAEAVSLADGASRRAALDHAVLDTLGVIYAQANEHERAATMFCRAVEAAPRQPGYRFNLAAALTFCGDLAGAEREYEACISLAPQHWPAHFSLAQLRRQQPGSDHIDRLQAQLAVDGHHRDAKLYLELALAKEYEDLGEHARSFGHLVAGKSTQRVIRAGARERDREMFAALMQTLPGEEPAATYGCQSDEPIFVIGMPRTGTTLVERILSMHPQVRSAGELPNFGIELKRASGSRTAPVLDADTVRRARDLDWGRLGAAYLHSTRPLTGHTPRFVDKLPHNFLYAGHIARALPRARIVCVRRNPMDTCLSNFRQLFALDSPYHDYSYDLLDVGHYYLLFGELMAHWQRTLPGRILQVGYESLVDDQEAQTRRLLEFCGLPWDPACLEFERNQAPVATASAVQVRSPIHRGAMHRWKLYRRELAPLQALFEGAGVAFE
jgi:tetratricopeptide (TPR) repeat protein